MLAANLDRGLSYLVLFHLAVGIALLPLNPGLVLFLPLAIVPSLIVAVFTYRRNPDGRWWIAPFGVAIGMMLAVATAILFIASKI